jgi:hypothetical protein
MRICGLKLNCQEQQARKGFRPPSAM